MELKNPSEEGIVYVPVELLKMYMEDVFRKLGVPAKEAGICAEVLIAADMRGIDSHGIGRLKMYYDRIKDGSQLPKTVIRAIKKTKTTALWDGGGGMGQVIAYKAMELAIKMAKKYGLGAVAVGNSSHFGIAGYYAEMAAKQNMIGIAVTNARKSVAPTFGAEPMLGTNPIAFGCPTDDQYDFLFDAATSTTQRGKIEILDRAEKDTPEGWVVDCNGNPYTNTKAILKDLPADKAFLLPLGGITELLGGHKGYGLATLVEILSTCLQGGDFMKDVKNNNLGHFFMAINIESFIPIETFKKTGGGIVRHLRDSKKLPGQNRIYVAGEKEYEMIEKRLKSGVPINPNLQKNIKIMREDLKLFKYDFPF